MNRPQIYSNEIHVLLNDIRSAHNVGSMLRTAEAIGVKCVHLSGFTPKPLDRFKRPVSAIAKTALGAELTIPWEYSEEPLSLIDELKRQGFTVIGLEQDARAVDYKKYSPACPVLLIVGSEVVGMSKELRSACDTIIEIPMRGEKESLNVSVAFGIAFFRLFDK